MSLGGPLGKAGKKMERQIVETCLVTLRFYEIHRLCPLGLPLTQLMEFKIPYGFCFCFLIDATF